MLQLLTLYLQYVGVSKASRPLEAAVYSRINVLTLSIGCIGIAVHLFISCVCLPLNDVRLGCTASVLNEYFEASYTGRSCFRTFLTVRRHARVATIKSASVSDTMIIVHVCNRILWCNWF